MKKIKTLHIVTSVLIVTVLCTTFYLTVAPQFFKKELIPVSVRLSWLHQAQFIGFYVAQEKGFYEDEDLDVELKEFEFEIHQGQELVDGEVDFAVASAQEVISFVDSGLPVKAIAITYQTSPYAFASLKDQNITSPAHLRGKTLGIAGGSLQAKVTYQALLNHFEISPEEVTFKELGFDTPQDVLTRQADVVDLYRTDQTYLIGKLGGEYNLLLPEQYDFGIYGDAIISSDDMIQNNTAVAKKFIRATFKGWEYALANKEEALQITALYENELYKDPEYERYIFEQSIPLIKPTGTQKLGDMQYVKWKKAFDAMKSAGVIESEMNVEDIFTFSILEE